MLVGMCLFQNWEDDCAGKTRMEMVKGFYDVTSTFKLSLPTPIMAGVRTPTRQFSSCVLIESGDSLKGISAASAAIIDYVSRRAGIGIGFTVSVRWAARSAMVKPPIPELFHS